MAAGGGPAKITPIITPPPEAGSIITHPPEAGSKITHGDSWAAEAGGQAVEDGWAGLGFPAFGQGLSPWSWLQLSEDKKSARLWLTHVTASHQWEEQGERKCTSSTRSSLLVRVLVESEAGFHVLFRLVDTIV